VGERAIASLTFLDTLEHIVNGPQVVAMLRRLADRSSAPLVLSVPNVTHKDIALKLLGGRWDVTEAGLLDHTHVEGYSNARLALLMEAGGWRQSGQKDWLLETSDQRFPESAPALDPSLPVGNFLRRLIEDANPHFMVNQFVRAYRVDEPKAISLWQDRLEPQGPQFTLLMAVADGAAARAPRICDSLARQTNQDFQLVVVRCIEDGASTDGEFLDSLPESLREKTGVVARSTHGRAEALNDGLARARGRHVVILHEDDDVEPDWLATFSELSVQSPRAVLRVGARAASATSSYSRILPFDVGVVECPAAYAIPTGVFKHLGLRFDSTAQPNEEAYLIARAIIFCGVNTSPRILAAPNLSPDGSIPPSQYSAGRLSFAGIIDRLDERPLLLPFGSANKIAGLVNTAQQLSDEKIGAVFGNLNRSFSERYHGPGECAPTAEAASSHDAHPFLSVITRTRGSRNRTLRETLMSLAGQSSQNFELLLVVHSGLDEMLTNVTAIVAEFPASFRERVSIAQCKRPGRSAPLNDALKYARGRYVAVLDDDDFVFAHWVETFEKLADEKPGAMLRATCTRQDFSMNQIGEARIPRAQSWFIMEWPSSYDAIRHLHANYTPFMSMAIPIEFFRVLEMRWDESLSTLEDWQMATHVAMNCGVVSAPQITSVYRWWTNSESSVHEHGASEWTANRQRVIDSLDAQPLLLPPGSASSVCELIDASQRLQGDLNAKQENVRSLEIHLDDMRRHEALIQQRLDAVVNSTSWRLTAPIRFGARLLPSGVRWRLRRVAKAIWWAATPWAIPRRLRAIKARAGQSN